MRNLLIVLTISIGAYYWYYYGTSPFDSFETLANGDIVITKADTKLTFTDQGDFSTDLRIFGKSGFDGDAGSDPAPHPLLATPMAENAQVFNKFMCEINSLKSASLINVIPATAKLLRTVSSFKGGDERSCFNLVGKSLYLKGINPEASDFMNVRTQLLQANAQFGFEPKKYIFMTELTPIDCK